MDLKIVVYRFAWFGITENTDITEYTEIYESFV